MNFILGYPGKKSWNFVYIFLAVQHKTPFILTNLLTKKIKKKFVKLCLRLSYKAQNSFQFDEFFFMKKIVKPCLSTDLLSIWRIFLIHKIQKANFGVFLLHFVC